MINTPVELKASSVAEDGTISGYAAIFGNVDDGGDMIEPGAFKEFVKTRDGRILLLYQHRVADPIGQASVTQDSVGLHFSGRLELDDVVARKAYTLMKSGLIDAMSIGFDVLPGGAEILNSGIRKLTRLKLYEISPVTWGMNVLARVDAVKMLDCVDQREIKSYLRSQHNFSRGKASAGAEALWKILKGPEDSETEKSEQLAEQLSRILAIQSKLKGR